MKISKNYNLQIQSPRLIQNLKNPSPNSQILKNFEHCGYSVRRSSQSIITRCQSNVGVFKSVEPQHVSRSLNTILYIYIIRTWEDTDDCCTVERLARASGTRCTTAPRHRHRTLDSYTRAGTFYSLKHEKWLTTPEYPKTIIAPRVGYCRYKPPPQVTEQSDIGVRSHWQSGRAQDDPSPPHTPHSSTLLVEPMRRSHPTLCKIINWNIKIESGSS